MKPHFVLFLVFILSTSVRAQNDLKVFKSYDDYVAGNGEEMMYKNLYWPSAKSIGIKALKGSENVKIDPREHWGFTYKDVLFRFDHTYNQPVRVVHVGPLVFYRNGEGGVRSIQKGGFATYSYGYESYLSKDLSSEIIPLDTYVISDTKGKFAAFKKKYPQYKTFFECIGNRPNSAQAERCAKEFVEP